MTGLTADKAKALREPFPAASIGKLPKGGATLDYVGHAAVTDRLLAVDPLWTWEPVAFDEQGLPLVAERGKDAVLWIRLTVCGHTRLGVGIVPAGAFERDKQLISDAIRNAAMRFGVALDLWAKEDLHAGDEPEHHAHPDADLKRRVLEVCGGDRGLARRAWEMYHEAAGLDGDALLDAVEEWVNLPADEATP